MRRRLFRAVGVMVAAALAALALSAEPPPEKVKQIEYGVAHVNDRASNSLAMHLRRLIGHGPDAIPFIRKALAESADSEQKLLLKIALMRILGKGGPAPAGKLNPDGTRVTVQLKQASLADVLWQLAEQSGNTPMTVPSSWVARPLDFDVKDCPYWEAVARLGRLTGFGVGRDELHDSGAGAGLSEPIAPDAPVAVAGPGMIRLESVYITRAFRPRSGGGGLIMQFAFLYEDRLPVRAASVRVRTMRMTGGRDVATGGKPSRTWDFRQGIMGFSLDLDNVPLEADAIAELSGDVTLTFEGDPDTQVYEFTFTDLPLR